VGVVGLLKRRRKRFAAGVAVELRRLYDCTGQTLSLVHSVMTTLDSPIAP